MVSEQRLKELIEIKNKQRAISKAQYMKDLTNPHRHALAIGGTIFDSGIQRWMAMEATRLEFFKPNTRNAVLGFFTYIVPVGIVMYLIKTSRDKREAKYRSGVVSYRDREYKYV